MISDRIATLIRESGRSQVDLSRESGVSQPAISAILSGNRTNLRAEVVARIARALGLSATSLGRELYAGIDAEKIPENNSGL